MPDERKAYKDYFDRDAARRLGSQIEGAFSDFDGKKFAQLATRKLDGLEFHGRVKQFSGALAGTLPASVPEALDIITRSLPGTLPDCEQVTDGWLQWPVGQFIADYGLDHFDQSMQAMIALTQRFTSEFAVRPFVEKYPAATFEKLLSLTDHPSPHVRRWCSEGVRTRLPWGKKLHHLIADPSPIWPILEKLKDDPELYVRRSVANNVNDLAKDHPQAVTDRCQKWSKQSNSERNWLINHSLRTMIKDGHPEALAIIGFGPPKKLTAELRAVQKRISIGESVELIAALSSEFSRPQKLLIDYAVHYVRKGGKSGSKIFKWKQIKLPARGSATLTKKHSMRLTMTRALYPGTHKIELQVNGERVVETMFELV